MLSSPRADRRAAPLPGRLFRMWAVRALALALIVTGAVAFSGCTRREECQDPTREGMCFCPVGQSCHHDCGAATGHCTLGCAQANPSCSVACTEDCTALCSGAGRCDSVCGDRCNVSCEWVKESCTATVGADSRVNCTGAANCDVRCQGPCDVVCPNGHCRLSCAAGESPDCEMSCGGTGAAARPQRCADGSQVCGRAC